MKSFSFLDVDSRIQQAVVIKALSGVLTTLPGLYSAAAYHLVPKFKRILDLLSTFIRTKYIGTHAHNWGSWALC